MCGFAGLWNPLARADEAAGRVATMRDVLRSRGPDDEGAWSDPAAGIYLGHRRLSVLDLSSIAAQPMGSTTGRYQIVYNGEVYNFRALREELSPRAWRTDGDTEVVLAAIETWGLEPALGRFVGMFAFALWDAQERCLFLVRDRLGIKPLVYGHHGGALLFGSTLAALAAHPDHDDALDHGALAGFLRLSCVPAPHTIYRADKKVRPGTYVRFGAATDAGRQTHYWDAAALRQRAVPWVIGDEEAAERVEHMLREAVCDRLVSDVPVGAFLSGGIDSSLVTALMCSSGQRVRTFSIGNERADYDESAAARAVSDHLGTDHTELIVTGDDALALIPKLGEMADEPFADPSLLPTYLVSRLARGHVTVALSGDGGDELFGGYNRHFWGPAIWRGLEHFPAHLRALGARGIEALSPDRWDALLTGAGRLSFPVRLPGDKLHKLAGVLASPDADAFYLGLQSHYHDPLSALAGPALSEARPPDVTSPPEDF
ncbi:MAG TPA: asparagine synthase (glutamine-hydrolyzing), partial [Polyangiaceae bacterium]|nr:asparagine synthase (glutamine-hydrolyzing) [Polyangiaceae bacterium]